MTYTPQRIKKEFSDICLKADVECDTEISINGRLSRTLGRVMFSVSGELITKINKVEFSKSFIENGADKDILDVIMHEAAHYISIKRTGVNHGHDRLFKEICKEIGTNNNKTSISLETASETKYDVVCPNCDRIGGYSRRCKTLDNISTCSCKRCGSKNLKVIQNW